MVDPFPLTVAGFGEVTLCGHGPWSVTGYGPGAFIIVDALGENARTSASQPMRHGGSKTNSNIVFSKFADADKVVKAVNAAISQVKP